MLLTAAAALLLTPAAPAMPITARSRSVQPGEVIVLSIVAPEAATSLHVRAFDHDVVTWRDGGRQWRALVGIDLDVKPGTYAVTIDAGGGAAAHGTYDLVVKPRAFRTRRLRSTRRS